MIWKLNFGVGIVNTPSVTFTNKRIKDILRTLISKSQRDVWEKHNVGMIATSISQVTSVVNFIVSTTVKNFKNQMP